MGVTILPLHFGYYVVTMGDGIVCKNHMQAHILCISQIMVGFGIILLTYFTTQS